MSEGSPIPSQVLEACEAAVRENPANVTAWFRLGVASRAAGRLDAAAGCFRTVLRLNPRHADAYVECGLILKKQGDLGGAIRCYSRATELDPRSVIGYFNLGNALREHGDRAKARSCYEAALNVNPAYVQAWNNLGLLSEEQGDLDGALAQYREAVAIKPDFAGAHMNLGNVLKQQNLLGDAVASYRRAIEIQPDFPEAHHSLGLALLGLGKLEEGWPEFEWRLRCRETGARIGVRSFPRPLWDGSPLAGRTLLVYAEQGYGDTMQFARYLPLLKNSGGRILFGCYPDLHRLFRNLAGVDRLVDITASALPGFDVYTALLSLPGLLHSTLPALPSDVPYVRADPALQQPWTERTTGSGVNVGLVWMSNTQNKIGREKSFTLKTLAPLGGVEGVSFYSLQTGDGARDAGAPPSGLRLRDLAGYLQDFADTATAIAGLDLVITVDTAVAHLAGALGKPVWTLLPFAADWRWQLDREDTPWYPTMRLFRQRRRGDWDQVVRQVRDSLHAFIEERKK